MAKISVYVDAEFNEAIKAADLPISAICQAALAVAIEEKTNPNPVAEALRRINSGTRMLKKAVE